MNIPQDILELIDTLLDGTIKVEGRQVLHAYLTEHPEVSKHVLHQLEVNTLLSELYQGRDFNLETAEAVRISLKGNKAIAATRARVQSRPRKARKKQASLIPFWTAMAASLAIFAGVIYFITPPAGDTTTVTEVAVKIEALILSGGEHVQVSQREGRANTVHSDLAAGDTLQVTGGSATIGFANDESTIDLATGSRLSIENSSPGKRLTLLDGSLRAKISPQRNPLAISTQNSQVLVMGTEFTLEADETTTRLEMIEGNVQLTNKTTNESIEAPAGLTVIASAGKPLNVISPAEVIDFRIVETFGKETREINIDSLEYYLAHANQQGNTDLSSVIIKASDTFTPPRPHGADEPEHGGFNFLANGRIVQKAAFTIEATKQSESISIILDSPDNLVHTARFYLYTYNAHRLAAFEVTLNGRVEVLDPPRDLHHYVVEVTFRGKLDFSLNQQRYFKYNAYGLFGLTVE